MKDLIIDCLEKDFDREFLYSIKNLDIEIVVETVVENYEKATINDLIYEAIQRHIRAELQKKECNTLWKNLRIESVSEFDEYINIWVNGLDSKVSFLVTEFVSDFNIDDNDDMLQDLYSLVYLIEHFKI